MLKLWRSLSFHGFPLFLLFHVLLPCLPTFFCFLPSYLFCFYLPSFFIPYSPFPFLPSACLPILFLPFLHSAFLNSLISHNDCELLYTINRHKKFPIFYTDHASTLLKNWNIQRDMWDIFYQNIILSLFFCCLSVFNQVFNLG